MPGLCLNTLQSTWRSGLSVRCHETTVCVEPSEHAKCAEEKSRTTAPAVDPEESGDCTEDVNDVLNARRDEKIVSLQTGHGKDVHDIVHHDVHSGKLRPDLSEDADVSAVNHVRLEELKIRYVCVATLKFAHALDFFVFALHEGRVGVAFAVNEGKHCVAVLPSVLTGEPTR